MTDEGGIVLEYLWLKLRALFGDREDGLAMPGGAIVWCLVIVALILVIWLLARTLNIHA